MTTVGIIYPGYAAEDDYPQFEKQLPGVHLPVVHSYGDGHYAVDDLVDLGSHERLAAAAEQLHDHRPDVIMWAGTSGSFVLGVDGARAQVERLAKTCNIPVSSTSFAFLRAVYALGVHRVAVAASYPGNVAERFVGFLSVGGLNVVSLSSGGIQTSVEVSKLTDEQVLKLAVANDHPDAEVLLIPDTALHTAALLPQLEAAVGKPVLTANQVTVWEGLRMAGDIPSCESAGTLFNAATIVRVG